MEKEKKYYKILPANLNDSGFQYQEGVNSNTYPGVCCFYFTEAQHIFWFCDHGDVIAEVEIPEDATVQKRNLWYESDKIILKNIRPFWTIKVLEEFMELSANIEECGYLALRAAASTGRLDIVKYLKERGVDVHMYEDLALFLAKSNAFTDVVEYLQSQ